MSILHMFARPVHPASRRSLLRGILGALALPLAARAATSGRRGMAADAVERYEAAKRRYLAVEAADPYSDRATAAADEFVAAENHLIEAIRAGAEEDDPAPRGLIHGGKLYLTAAGDHSGTAPGIGDDIEEMRLVAADLAAIVGLAGPSA